MLRDIAPWRDDGGTRNELPGQTEKLRLGSTGAVPMVERQAIVNDGGTWEETIPVQFNASLVGMKKVIFELWVYDTAASRFIFTNQFLHAWIDVLAP